MRRLKMEKEHYARLEEYGLQRLPEASCVRVCYEPGEIILREGEEIPWFILVIRGRIKICRTAANGKRLILCYYASEGIIGDLELLTHQETATATALALSQVECIAISCQSCRSELKANTVFLNQLGAALAQKLNRSTANFASAALCSGVQRLCAYILQAACRDRFCDVLADVSCALGMSYRHLFRLLDQLCDDKVLQKGEGGYLIVNRAELEKRSQSMG